MAFVTNARYALITYAQSNGLDPHEVVSHFAGLEAECIIGRELHADGNLHHHVFVDFGRKFRSRKADVFDVAGFHPNISASRGTPWAGYDYAIKDGDVVAGGLGRPTERQSTGKAAVDWDAILSAGSRDEFLELCLQLAPRDAVCSWNSIIKFADWRYRVEPEEYVTPAGIEFDTSGFGELDTWVSQSGCRPGSTMTARPKSLILYGASRLGKTLWARSHGAHIYCIGLVSGAECMKAASCNYAVFDDIRGGIKFFPAFKEWLGGQRQVTVKQLYREPQLLDWGKPSIWLANVDPRLGMDPSDSNWLEENAYFVELTDSIFRANTA
ncbi:replication-associated protein [Blackfly genomovirus 9]|uniref:Replication-associated protein n=1 Tax=Blackfly genomovirus 9 TaxID=2586208 RepID=A0A4Y5QKX6_9VIRU|nr:replication-associated protein [Blackfly genomovirus 9]QCX35073.1 replication-associated protein [Blackfly genomovirus 9]